MVYIHSIQRLLFSHPLLTSTLTQFSYLDIVNANFITSHVRDLFHLHNRNSCRTSVTVKVYVVFALPTSYGIFDLKFRLELTLPSTMPMSSKRLR